MNVLSYDGALRVLKQIRDDTLRVDDPDFARMTEAINRLSTSSAGTESADKECSRTDELLNRKPVVWRDWKDADFCDLESLARQLERELAEAIEDERQARSDADEWRTSFEQEAKAKSSAGTESADKESRLLTNEQFIVRLMEAGYSREVATVMLRQDLQDAAEEDGYDGP